MRRIASVHALVGLFVCTFFTTSVFAVVPPLIPVQGVLTDADGQVLDGSHDLSFTIYESLTATSSLWTETQTDVTVDQGFFSVYLGDETALPIDVIVSAGELWLSMTVDAEELSRVQLASVPYALESQVCKRLGDLKENEVQPILSGDNVCPEGHYLRGWDADAGSPICAADMLGDAGPVPYIHDHDDLYYTETELSTSGGGGIVHWDNLDAVPALVAPDQTCPSGQRVSGIDASGNLTCASIIPSCTIRSQSFVGESITIDCLSGETVTGGGFDLSDGDNNGMNWNSAASYPSGNGYYCMRNIGIGSSCTCYAICCSFPN